MKKIIYNEKLKKVLFSILVSILILQFLMSNYSIAMNYGVEEEHSYNEWITNCGDETASTDLASNNIRKQKNAINEVVKAYIEDNIYKSYTDSEVREEKVNQLLNDRGDNIIIKGILYQSTASGGDRAFSYRFELNSFKDDELSTEELKKWGTETSDGGTEESDEKVYTYSEFKEFLGGDSVTDEEVKKILKEPIRLLIKDELKEFGDYDTYTDKIISKYKDEMLITVKGSDKNNYKIIAIEVPGVDAEQLVQSVKDEIKDDTADGGILLEPLFLLVNLVADTITSFLGEFMIGEDGLESVGMDGLRTSSYEGLSASDVYRVSTNSFLLGTSYYKIPYTPEKIFSGTVGILSIDFISGKDAEGNLITGDWQSIRKVISEWYKVLRMIAIIGLLSVLIYTGIKIIISSNAKDKAKYKEWIINWFIAVAILFFMHYIMSFVISVTNEISQLLISSNQEIIVEEIDSVDEMDKTDVNKEKCFSTNLMGLVRYMVRSNNAMIKIGYEIMYIMLITYTVKFTFVYLKRVLNMAFLTLIAPIVALTYPIDKLNDGQAQGFNMWLKEYIFNALLQPMHLILYYILLGSAVGIAASNPLYGIVVLTFMTEAERLLKKIFGFDKASGGTVGGMAGAFAAGAVASNVKNIAKLAGNVAKGPSGGGSEKPGENLMEGVTPEKDESVAEGFADNALDGDGPANGTGENEQQDNQEMDADASYLAELEQERTQDSWTNGDERAYQELREEYESRTGAQNNAGQGNGNPETTEQPQPENGQGGSGPEENGSTENNSNGSVNEKPIQEMKDDKDKKGGSKNLSKGKRIINGIGNVANNAFVKPIYDKEKGGEYNRERWKRRISKAAKTGAKMAIGGAVGLTAAAVQAGISLTDGKYNPMEGIATFAAGYAGGSGLAGNIGSRVSKSFNEGYYEGEEGKKELIQRQQKEFMYRDDIDKKYMQKYKGNRDEANKMKKYASDYLVPYGITDPKEQMKYLNFADKISGGDPNKMEAAMKRARQTQKFMSELKDQGQRKLVGSSKSKQDEYIKSMIKASGVTDKAKQAEMQRNYEIAFASAAKWDSMQ